MAEFEVKSSRGHWVEGTMVDIKDTVIGAVLGLGPNETVIIEVTREK